MFYILGVQALAMVGKLQTKKSKKIAVHFYVGELHDDKFTAVLVVWSVDIFNKTYLINMTCSKKQNL